ncbi:hypothetical protein ZIOFF_060223 [Zingiber officinale]|uniref:Uncharacterized protein n=1 Tax=Zingiber officinale TaxID=94328 RepID=A0A8J5FGE0_ZINOF|nr:hypothetical protein ZIOFF_060223 [Zingiber officinale]
MVGRVFVDEEEWGSDLSFRIRRRRTRFGTSTSSSFRGWEALICIPRGKVKGTCSIDENGGHPALIGRHAPFPVTHQAAERWHTAYFLVGGNEMTRQRQQVLNVSMQQMDHQHLLEIQLAL